jgi:hypothetical protein
MPNMPVVTIELWLKKKAIMLGEAGYPRRRCTLI